MKLKIYFYNVMSYHNYRLSINVNIFMGQNVHASVMENSSWSGQIVSIVLFDRWTTPNNYCLQFLCILPIILC